MGIIYELKKCKGPTAFKNFNKYLKFNARLAEAKTEVRFIQDCLQRNQYPKAYWKSLRRCHVRPTTKSLKRHAHNLLDAVQSRLPELERLCALYQPSVEDLDATQRESFKHYVQTLCTRVEEKKYEKLLKSLHPTQPEPKFPPNPENCVHNLSNIPLNQLQLEALSLGPKFCLNEIAREELMIVHSLNRPPNLNVVLEK